MLRAERLEKNNEKDLINEWLLWKKFFCCCKLYLGMRPLSCLTLCDSMDHNSSDHGIFQARILGWVAISYCSGPAQLSSWTSVSRVSCIGRRILYHYCHLESTVNYVLCLVTQSCQFFWTPWTVAHQAPLPMGFSRQAYWTMLPCPLPGDLPNPGIKPRSPEVQADSLLVEPPGKPIVWELANCMLSHRGTQV